MDAHAGQTGREKTRRTPKAREDWEVWNKATGEETPGEACDLLHPRKNPTMTADYLTEL